MSLADRIKALFRRRPVTEEELRARAEGEVVREQMLQDRLSQESGGGAQVYRSGGR